MRQNVRKTKADRANDTSRTQKFGVKLDLAYLEGTIGYAIRRAQMAVFQDIYRTFGDLNVTTIQFSVLAVVKDNPGVNQAELAAALGVERPRMVPVIDSLEKRGLAERVPSPTDRRHRQIFLTDAGESMLTELKTRFATHQDNMLSRLNDNSDQEILKLLWSLVPR